MTGSEDDERKALNRQRAQERARQRREYWAQRQQERDAARLAEGAAPVMRSPFRRKLVRRKPVPPPAPDELTPAELELQERRRREAERARAKAYYAENKAAVRERLLQRRSENPALYAARLLLANAQLRAKRDGLLLTITVDDVLPLITTHCPALGIELTAMAGPATDSSRTLDKVIPELGYVKHNIATISAFANRIKQEASAATLKRLIAKFHAVPTEPGPLDTARIPWGKTTIPYKSALLYHAKERAVCTVTTSDFVVPDRCILTGIKLIKGWGKLSKNSPSLDKIIPELGYVPGNVRVVSHFANRIKQNATLAQITAVAAWLEREEARVHAALGLPAPSPTIPHSRD